MIFVFLLFFAFFLHCVWSAYKDFAFYRNNDWDYTADSGVELFHGDTTDERARMGNRERLIYGHAFMLVGSAICSLIAFALWMQETP